MTVVLFPLGKPWKYDVPDEKKQKEVQKLMPKLLRMTFLRLFRWRKMTRYCLKYASCSGRNADQFQNEVVHYHFFKISLW
jgi:hypothetical protein